MDDTVIRKIQREASEVILDIGVSLPLKEWRIPFWKKPVQWRVTMRRPRLSGQMCITRIYLSMNVSPEELEAMSGKEQLQFMANHGVDISRMIAYTICQGVISRRLFIRPVAWFLREVVEHRFLIGAMNKFVNLMGTESFICIISSVDRANPMKLRLSQKKRGS